MIPSGVTDVLARISSLQQVPPAAARFMTSLLSSATTSAGTLNVAAVVSEALTPSAATATGSSPSAGRAIDIASGIAAQRAATPGLTGASSTTAPTTVPTSMRADRSKLPSQAEPWLGAINDAAAKAGLDPDLLTSLVWTESSFHPDSVSSAGAIGLAQLMPGTAASLGVDPHDPVQNLNGAARMLAGLIAKYGRVDFALAAYNQGPNAVDRGLANGKLPGAGYAATVIDHYRSLTGTEPGVTA